jgi:hypothetical protein
LQQPEEERKRNTKLFELTSHPQRKSKGPVHQNIFNNVNGAILEENENE